MATEASSSLPTAPDWQAFSTTTGTLPSASTCATCDASIRSLPPPGFSNARTPSPELSHHRRPARYRPAARGPAGHRAVPVEVHHVERLARFGGLAHRVAQGVEGRRAQHGQADLAANRVEPFEQRAGHHLVTHVAGAGRAGDHHQHPELPAGDIKRARAVGDREAAGDAARTQRHRAGAVAHQLPRKAEHPGVGGAEYQLKAAVTGPLVGITGLPRAEHRPEDQVSPAESASRGWPGRAPPTRRTGPCR